jgi:protein transport protein HofC
MNPSQLYQWSAQTLDGSIILGEMAAHSRQQVQHYLLLQGQFPLTLRRIARLPSFFSNQTALLFFTRQLGLLLHSGVTLQEGLSLLRVGEKKVAWRWLLQQIAQEIAAGVPFSQALQHYPTLFTPFYCSLIRVGEWSGQLDQCCLQLAQQQEKQLQLQQCLYKALFYPVFTLVFTWIVILFMLIVVIPQFQVIYQRFNTPLPLLTRGIVRFSRLFTEHGLTLLIMIILLLMGYAVGRQFHPRWRVNEQNLALKLPWIGLLIQQNCCARFTRTLAITQAAGLPLLNSLQAAGDSSGNGCYQHAATTISQAIQNGTSLKQAFSRHPLFPPLLQQMIAVGETTGALERTLAPLADFYEQQAHEQAAYLIKLLEPLMMTVIGVVVGALVLALYLPIFQLGEVIH